MVGIMKITAFWLLQFILIEIWYNCWQSCHGSQMSSATFKRFVHQGMVNKSAKAATSSMVPIEELCMMKCSNDPECRAASYDDVSKLCTLNHCGRVQLSKHDNFTTTYVKGISQLLHLTSVSIFIFPWLDFYFPFRIIVYVK